MTTFRIDGQRNGRGSSLDSRSPSSNLLVCQDPMQLRVFREDDVYILQR